MSQAKSLSIRYEDEVFSDELFDDREALSLLDQILNEVFNCVSEDEEHSTIEGNAIYFLESEQEIQKIEKYETDMLNEGCPEVEEFDLLMELAEEYFSNPAYYPVREDEDLPIGAKGFIQIYSGEKTNTKGESVVLWKSTDISVTLMLSDFDRPELIVKQVEALGFKWSELIRLCVYGPLKEIVGERIYLPGETKELVPLNEEYKNILIAVPAFTDSDEDSDSIYNFVEIEIQNNILYGSFPKYGRSLTGHWELANVRLQELEDEAAENRVLLTIQRRERNYVQSKNAFRDKYHRAYSLVSGLNNGTIDINELFAQETEVLKEVISLTDRKVLRVENQNVYLQLKALVIKETLHTIKTQQTQVILLLDNINSGKFVEFHLLNLNQLEELFSILWSKSGFSISSDKKDVYFLLKNNLLRLRSKRIQNSNH